MRIFKNFILFFGVVFLAVIVFLVATFAAVKHLKIKDIVEHQIEESLGIKVTINRVEFSPLLAHIALEGITVHNPVRFVEKEMAFINAIHLLIDPLELVVSKKPMIYVLAVDLERLNIIKNKDGCVNIKEIFPIKDDMATNEGDAPIRFGELVLSVGEVNYIDHASAKVQKFKIGMKNQTFIDLKDENDVIRLIVYKAIENTDVGKLINLTIMPVFSQVSNTVGAFWGAAKTGAKGMEEIAALPFKLLFGKN